MKVLTKKKITQQTKYFLILILLIVAAGGYFGFNNFMEYQQANANLTEGQNKLAELRVKADVVANNYRNLRNDFELQNSAIHQAVEKILPAEENFTALARELDNYFLRSSTGANPIFLSDLRFGNASVKTDQNYGVLPLTMTLTGSDTAFRNFLKYVENSGDMTNQTRILEINSFNLNTSAQGATDAEKTITLQMNSYFQKPNSK